MNPTKSNFAKSILPLAALTLFCACNKEQKSPATAGGAGSAIVSAEKTSFDEVTSKLDKGGNFYLYLSTEQTLSELPAKIAGVSNFVGSLPMIPGDQRENIASVFKFFNSWIKDSGVEEISGVGMSSIAREPGFYYGKLIIHHYPGQDEGAIWSIFGKKAHPLADLNLLPDNTAFAAFSDVDLARFWKDLRSHIDESGVPAMKNALDHWPAQFRQMTGLDFDKTLDSLGGECGIIFTLDADNNVSIPLPSGTVEVPNPGMAIVIKVKSDVIFNRVDQALKGNPLIVRVNKKDLKMRTATIPLPLPVELRPSVARSGDYLILATTDTMIEDMLAVKAGTKKGFKSTAEFARLSQGIPEEGNNFALVGDLFVKTMMKIQTQALTNKGSMTPAQIEAFQHAFQSGTNFGNYSVGANGPEGWEGIANGNQSAQSLLVGGAVGIAGAMAAIAIPNFTRARTTSQQNACINNLRLLDSAKQQWALENRKQSSDTPTMEDLKPYLGSKKLQCPAGGDYTIGSVGDKPTCSIPGHVLP